MANGYSTKNPDWATKAGYNTSISGFGAVPNKSSSGNGSMQANGTLIAGKTPVNPNTLGDSVTNGAGGSKKSSTSASGLSTAEATYLANLYGQRSGNAQKYYDASLGRINDAYNNAADAYGSIYERGMNALNSSYANQQDKLRSQANDSLREAYINKMISERDMPQKLAAMGISGGASESTLLDLQNNYGTSRQNINTGLNNNMADLAANYNNNANNLFSSYQQAMANLANNRANALNSLELNMLNNQDTYDKNYLSLLSSNPTLLKAVVANATANQNAVTPAADMSATNADTLVDVTQGVDTGNVSPYAKYLASMNGSNDMQIAQQMIRDGYSNQQVQAMLNSYYAKA